MPGQDSAPEARCRWGGAPDPGRRGDPVFASIASGRVGADGVPQSSWPVFVSSITPTVMLEPMDSVPTPADVRLEYRHRSADAVPRDGRPSPIPHYAVPTEAETRTTANSAVTQRHVGHSDDIAARQAVGSMPFHGAGPLYAKTT